MSKSKWKKVRLGQLADFRNGINYSKKNFGRGIKVINVKDFQDYSFARFDDLDEINPEGIIREESLLKDGDILFVRSNGNRELVGRSLYIRHITERISHSAFTIKARFSNDQAMPRFYAYLFRSPLIRQALTAYGGGTNISNLNQGILSNLEVPLPPLAHQEKIAFILSAYDDLIENNTRRIKILEEMAQAIYREWFVEFRPPASEAGAPGVEVRKATPKEKQLTGKDVFPKGWDIDQLGNHLAVLESGKRPKGGVGDLAEGVPSVGAENILSIGRHNYSSEKYVSREFYENMNKGKIADRDVAVYKDGAYIGRSTYFRDGFPHAECCVNEHVFLLRTNGERLSQNLLYLWLQQPKTVQGVRATNANAAQPGLNQMALRGLRLVVPNRAVAVESDQLVEPMLAGIITLAKKNEVLRRIRDLLLPKLISGEVGVENIKVL